MQRRGVRVRENGNAFDIHFAQRVKDANRNLAAIGDKNLVDHCGTHGGFSRDRNAFMPAWPSSLARALAMASAVKSSVVSIVRAATPKMSAFAAATAAGDDMRI